MGLYLLINAGISLIVLALIKCGNGTNTVNYYLSCFGILVWFIPYSLIAHFLPNEVLIKPVTFRPSLEALSDTTIVPLANSFDMQQLIYYAVIAAGLFGLTLFIKQLISTRISNSLILNHHSFNFRQDLSDKYQSAIYSSDNAPSGMLLGLHSPKIVVASSIHKAYQLDLIINHEKTHLKRYDNHRLCVLELIKCLFWWNPLIRLLAAKNTFFIEAICDEKTAEYYGLNRYVDDFAALILNNHKVSSYTLNSAATSNKSNNISRLKLLKENRVMTVKKSLIFTLTIGTALLAMIWHTFAIASKQNKEVLVGSVSFISVTGDKQQLASIEGSLDDNISSSNNTTFILNSASQSNEFINALSLQDIQSINALVNANSELQLDINKQSNQSSQGAVVGFEVQVEEISNDEVERVNTANMSMRVDFDKTASFKVNDELSFDFKVSDLGKEQVLLDMEVIESSPSGVKLASNPKMQTMFNQEAMIKIDSPKGSARSYAIKLIAEKSSSPE